jgi:hypothetical protein
VFFTKVVGVFTISHTVFSSYHHQKKKAKCKDFYLLGYDLDMHQRFQEMYCLCPQGQKKLSKKHRQAQLFALKDFNPDYGIVYLQSVATCQE